MVTGVVHFDLSALCSRVVRVWLVQFMLVSQFSLAHKLRVVCLTSGRDRAFI